jgi:Protein of unknown function (DUF3040)
MPLSEHEQRILSGLEESLESDARFVHSVDAMNMPARRKKIRVYSLVGFIVGLAILVVGFTYSVLLGILGVVLMLGSSLYFVDTLTQSEHVIHSRRSSSH